MNLHAAMDDLRIGEHLIEIVDRAGRHADRFELVQQIVALEFARQPRQMIDQLLAVTANSAARTSLQTTRASLAGKLSR